MKSRILATVAVAAVLALGVSSPAFAQSYTGGLSANSAAPGGTVHYSADQTGQPDGTAGSYSLTGGQSKALGGPAIDLAASVTHDVRVGSHSSLAFAFRIPANAKPGSVYTLNVNAGTFSDSQKITVIGVAPSAATSNLTGWWIAIAALILILLALIFVVARRRKRAESGTAAA